MKSFFRFSAYLLPYVAVFFVVLYLLFHTSSLLLVVSAVTTAWLIAFSLKMIFHKSRPHHRTVNALFDSESKFSFPSEHSAIFAALGISIYSVHRVFGAVLLFIAFLIGISRVAVGVHFGRDIIVGWGIGIISALFFI